jgi:hypothetical protein
VSDQEIFEEINSDIDKLSLVSDKNSMVDKCSEIDQLFFRYGKMLKEKSNIKLWESLFKRYREVEKETYMRVLQK